MQVLETNPANQNMDGVNGIPVTLTFSGGASEIATPGALTATTTAGGQATINDIAVNTPGTGYTFTVASPVLAGAGLTKVISNTFNVLTLAATPTISPNTATYYSVQTVTISSTTAGATIYYTTDGITTPTTSSTLYTGPLTVSTNETIQAIAVAPGFANSTVASATFSLQVATPTFSPAGGSYTSPQTVTINMANPSAMIYYTTDGTTPTASSTVYLGPFTVSSGELIQAIAIAPGFYNSEVGSANYSISVPATAQPTFSPAGESYTSAQTVTISDATSGAAIYYTTDGTLPTTSSTTYTVPIQVSSSETITAIAVASGYSQSGAVSATYTILAAGSPGFTVAVTPATLSVTGGQSGSVTVSVTPQNGFSSAVSFACSGLPAGATCTFAPATVTPTGTAASTTKLTVTTAATTAELQRNSSPLLPASTLAVAFCLLGWKKRRSLQLLLLLMVSVIGLSVFNGCGGGSASSNQKAPPPVTATVTVTGTSGTGTGAIQNSATFSLTVN